MKLFLAISAFLMLFCYQDQPVEVLKTSGQEIIGGRNETSTKWYYTFLVRTLKSSRKIHFEKIWIGKTAGIPEVWDMDKTTEIRQFSKGDTILLIVTMMRTEDQPKAISVPSGNSGPPDYKGAGLIEMRFRKMILYHEISSIELRDPLILR